MTNKVGHPLTLHGNPIEVTFQLSGGNTEMILTPAGQIEGWHNNSQLMENLASWCTASGIPGTCRRQGDQIVAQFVNTPVDRVERQIGTLQQYLERSDSNSGSMTAAAASGNGGRDSPTTS